MGIVIMAKRKNKAAKFCSEILPVCLAQGCYADFVPTDAVGMNIVKRHDTIIVIAEDEESLRIAEKFKEKGHKIILVTNDNEIAAQTFETDIRVCVSSLPDKNIYNQVIEKIFL